MKINSSCDCCEKPPWKTDVNFIEYMLVRQTANSPSCGFWGGGEDLCENSPRGNRGIDGECIPPAELVCPQAPFPIEFRCGYKKYLTMTVTNESPFGYNNYANSYKVQYDQFPSINEFGSLVCKQTITEFIAPNPNPIETCRITTVFSDENDEPSFIPETMPNFPNFFDGFGRKYNDGQPSYPEDCGQSINEWYESSGGASWFVDSLENTNPSLNLKAYKFIIPRNEKMVSEQKSRYRVKHMASASCYLKVWFRKIIQNWKFEDCVTGFVGDSPRTPQLQIDCNGSERCFSRWSTNGDVTYENGPIYEWNGSNTPCFAEKTIPPDDCANLINGDALTDLVAGDNQSIILQWKYSLIKNYEPNWPDENGSQGCNPNGYPIINPNECNA